jgi:hypothetical protein
MRDGAHHHSFTKVSKETDTVKNIGKLKNLGYLIGIAGNRQALVIVSSYTSLLTRGSSLLGTMWRKCETAMELLVTARP